MHVAVKLVPRLIEQLDIVNVRVYSATFDTADQAEHALHKDQGLGDNGTLTFQRKTWKLIDWALWNMTSKAYNLGVVLWVDRPLQIS